VLTPRTKDITIEHMNKAYQYIDEVIKERGYAPSVMDITKYLGYASKSSTHRILKMMEDEGMIILPKRNEGKIVIAKKDVRITKNGLEPNDKKV
jgi:SOS-response transcriptional repressor LexA